MKKNSITIFFLCGFLLLILFVPLALAEVTVPSETRFSYVNGSYFFHPGTYDNATLINNIWYFNNIKFTPLTSGLYPLSHYENALNAVYTNMYIALGLIGVSLIIIACLIILRASKEDSESSVLPGFTLLIGTVIGLILAFVIISAFQNSTNALFILSFIK
jgi:hypothetical protein